MVLRVLEKVANDGASLLAQKLAKTKQHTKPALLLLRNDFGSLFRILHRIFNNDRVLLSRLRVDAMLKLFIPAFRLGNVMASLKGDLAHNLQRRQSDRAAYHSTHETLHDDSSFLFGCLVEQKKKTEPLRLVCIGPIFFVG